MRFVRRRFGPALVGLSLLAACGSGSGDGGASPSGPTVGDPGAAPVAPVAPAPTRTGAPASAAAAGPDLAGVEVGLRQLARLDRPVAVAVRPGEQRPGRLYVAEQSGRIRTVDADGSVGASPVVDLRSRTEADGEQGLLGLAFSPDGARLYVNYTDRNGDTNIDELTMTASGKADPDSRRGIMRIEQPYANHNGGHLVTGPDGLLYIGTGDGGSAGDPQGNGQDLGSLLGKLLRIDPTPAEGRPYRVPADNPFVGVAGARGEIWSYGLRNPWRFSFDGATGDLWIGDVGQNAIEEIDVVRAAQGAGRGANFGWNAFEGSMPYAASVPAPGAVAPYHEYRHGDGDDEGCSVTGGVVYRQGAILALRGAYLFADYCSGGLRAIPAASGSSPRVATRLLDEPAKVVAVALDGNGEVIVLSHDGGVYRVISRS